jgi:hypothetical protein
MTPDIAMELVWDWGLVFLGVCLVLALGLSFIRDALKGE